MSEEFTTPDLVGLSRRAFACANRGDVGGCPAQVLGRSAGSVTEM
jgi:hypothetical protein